MIERPGGDDPGASYTDYGAGLRDRLQTGANATMATVTEQMRRVSPQLKELNRRMRDPLARPTT